jgi:hypothetical protein
MPTIGSANIMLSQEPLRELARRCHEETLRFMHALPHDDAFCFEVFRRAIAGRDDEAWTAVVAQFRGIVLASVRQHSVAAMMREPDDYWVNRAFQRFWSAVGADRFGQFPDLSALLKYLKVCVHSVLMDEVRARRKLVVGSLEELSETAADHTDAGQTVLGEMAADELWATIMGQLQDEAEQIVAYLSFARDMKPAAIFRRHPRRYDSVADVYRIKRNVIERLRRSAEVRAFLLV